MRVSLAKAAEVMNGELIGADDFFGQVCTDTRTLKAGDLFFALKGENFNGEAFVERAFESGACAAVLTRTQDDLSGPQIVVDDATTALGCLANYWRNQLRAKVVAVTGSCGKTSVKGMLREVLGQAGRTFATQENFNNHIGVPLTIFACPEGADYLVVEAGTSTPGEIGYLTQIIDPDVSLVINVHPAHIQGFGSLDAIAREKSQIYSEGKREPIAAINSSLLKYDSVHDKSTFTSVVEFSSTGSLDLQLDAKSVFCEDVELAENDCARLTLNVGDEKIEVKLGVQGRHQVENAMAAAACAAALELNVEKIAKGLALYAGDKGRMQVYTLQHGVLIDDSYNANPASMRAAIDLLSKKSRSILVLGDMGELGADAEQEHREVGSYASAAGIGQLVCKGAFADDYCDGFGAGAKKIASFEELIAYLHEQVSDDTTILIKGSRFTRMDTVCRGLLSLEKQS